MEKLNLKQISSLTLTLFAIFFGAGNMIFALPRTGSVSYELAIRPYIPQEYVWLVSLLVTAVFFSLTYYFSGNPKKIVDIIGQYMTPILILSITVLYFVCLFADKSGNVIQYGAVQSTGEYQDIAFFKGMIEGYNALDGPAGPVFAIIIINAVTGFGVRERKSIVKYTIFSGMGAVLILSGIYYMLAYIGATTQTVFANGGALLHAVASDLIGPAGGIVLGMSVFLACMTTAIGLTTSSRVDSAALVSKNHGNCLSVQFCSQQCRAVLHDYHFSAGADDDLPGTDCVDCSILWTQMDREKKDGLYF